MHINFYMLLLKRTKTSNESKFTDLSVERRKEAWNHVGKLSREKFWMLLHRVFQFSKNRVSTSPTSYSCTKTTFKFAPWEVSPSTRLSFRLSLVPHAKGYTVSSMHTTWLRTYLFRTYLFSLNRHTVRQTTSKTVKGISETSDNCKLPPKLKGTQCMQNETLFKIFHGVFWITDGHKNKSNFFGMCPALQLVTSFLKEYASWQDKHMITINKIFSKILATLEKLICWQVSLRPRRMTATAKSF